jgi:hypothetical protein
MPTSLKSHTTMADHFTQDALRALQARTGAIKAENQKRMLVVVLLLTFMAATYLLISTFVEKRKETNYSLERDAVTRAELGAVEQQASDLRNQLEKQRTLIEKLSASIGTAPTRPHAGDEPIPGEEEQALDQVIAGQAQLSNRMSALENALANSPEKALTLPLLKQQLMDEQDRIRGDFDEINAEFGRLYTMVQWAIGLIMTVILGLTAFVIRRPGEKPKSEAATSTGPNA